MHSLAYCLVLGCVCFIAGFAQGRVRLDVPVYIGEDVAVASFLEAALYACVEVGHEACPLRVVNVGHSIDDRA